MQDFIKNIIEDVRVDLTDEFVKNLIDKGFFGKKWEDTKIPNRKGSMMIRSGNLFRDIKKPKVSEHQITWSSSLPYASLQNEGGEIIVTEKMKRFFWAMFYKANGAVTPSGKGKRNERLSQEAQTWKALALQKVGAKMKVKQRQFIGDHPQLRQNIERVVDRNMKELEQELFNRLRR